LPSVRQRLREGAVLETIALDRAQKVQLGVGKLSSHDNQIDITTGTVRLRAMFDNSDEALFPQQFVNIRLLVDTVKDATVVPVSAIQKGQPGTFVYRVKPDDTVEIRVVETGAGDGEKMAVVKGLEVGDQVVVDGTDRLRDGSKIRRINQGSGASGPPVAAAPPDSKGSSGNGNGAAPPDGQQRKGTGPQGANPGRGGAGRPAQSNQ
jgi:multidrug efflux system membrane fusion protein